MQSVGGSSKAEEFCEFCEICGRFSFAYSCDSCSFITGICVWAAWVWQGCHTLLYYLPFNPITTQQVNPLNPLLILCINSKKIPPPPYGIRSDGERNLIGRRTESDRTANATGKSFKLSKTANIGRKSVINRRFDRKWLFFVRNILLFLQNFSLLCSRNLTQYCSCVTHI